MIHAFKIQREGGRQVGSGPRWTSADSCLLPSSVRMTSSESYEHLLPPSWKAEVTAWLAEDTPSFDYGGYVVGEAEREAFLFGKGKQAAVLAGSPFFTEIFAQLGCQSVAVVLLRAFVSREAE
jgi:hypothetical protein